MCARLGRCHRCRQCPSPKSPRAFPVDVGGIFICLFSTTCSGYKGVFKPDIQTCPQGFSSLWPMKTWNLPKLDLFNGHWYLITLRSNFQDGKF